MKAERNRNNQRGAAIIEAALLIVLISLIAIPSAKYIGDTITQRFQLADDEVASANADTTCKGEECVKEPDTSIDS